MRILVISNMYPSKKSISFGIFVKNQVEALRKKGLFVDVLAVKNPSSAKLQVILKYINWSINTALSLLVNGKKYSVIHAHYVFPSGLLGLMFKKFHPSVKLIVTAHGGDINRMAKKNRTIQKWTRNILHEADHVIAVGEDLYSEIHEAYHVPSDKLSLVSMGVNTAVFKPYDKNAIRAELKRPPGISSILFVGNIIREKGLLELLGAYNKLKRELPNIRLDLVGKIKNKEFFDELNAYISEHTLADVHFHGALEQVDVAKMMSAADVFVLPSHMEGFGLVAVEAMACHTPVVASNVGGLSYLLSDERGVLVESQNEKALYSGIFQVLNNKELAMKFVKNSEQKVKENDEDYIIDKIVSIYRQ